MTAEFSAVIFGVAGETLGAEEAAFFAEAAPLGFILFQRNCGAPEQITALTAALRAAAGRPDAPVLIDQEGGRVQRLQPPRWRQAPPARDFGELAERAGEAAAVRACWLNARLIAADLFELGIDVDCLPCLDLARPETHSVIGDRAFSPNPGVIAALGRAQADGLLAGGVLPVLKHLPGHGRAVVDSHDELPVVDCDRAELSDGDFRPFRELRGLPLGMTAHIVFRAIDPHHPATQSAALISGVIRGEIGFDGLLLSDDLNMDALAGDLAERARAALAAGCDVALHCNGDLAEMRTVRAAAGPMSTAAQTRWERASALRQPPRPFDSVAALAELSTLLAT